VHVWRDGAPASRVRVRAEIDVRFEDDAPIETRELESITDGSGRCVFDADGMLRGVAFIATSGRSEVRCGLPKPDQMRHPRVYVSLGGATVFGIVSNASGEPIEGAEVRVKCGAERWTIFTHSGPDGVYELTDLPGGPAVVSRGSAEKDVVVRPAPIELAPREIRRVDLGGSDGSVLWRGRVTSADASDPEPPGLWIFSNDSQPPQQVSVQEGRFQIRLMPGEYEVSRTSSLVSGSTSVRIGEQDVEFDLVLPPAREARGMNPYPNNREIRRQ